MSTNQMADVATNLRAIEDMAGRLSARAVDRSGDKAMPGGAAMIALGGVGSIRDWMRRIELGEQRAEATGIAAHADISNEDPDELWPSLQILWWWTEDYRRRLHMDYEDPRWRPSLTSEARFLRNHDVATWIWDNEPKFDTYAADVARAKTKLENILHEGERAERTRVVCQSPDCTDHRTLIRVYAKREPIGWECQGCGDESNHPDPCDSCGSDAKTEIRWQSDPDDDLWKCGGCKRKYTQDEVNKFHAKQLRSDGAERWVSMGAAMQLMRDQGWQERVVRSWFTDTDGPKVEMAMEAEGREVVWWPSLWRHQLLERHDREQARVRAEARAARKKACVKAHGEDCWVKGRGCSVELERKSA